MSRMVQHALAALEVQRLETGGEGGVQKVDLDEIPLHMAKAQIGGALSRTIARTDSALKDFGDPSQVKRVCDGEVPSVIARAWQREDTRRELVKALAEASGLFDVRTQIFEKVG